MWVQRKVAQECMYLNMLRISQKKARKANVVHKVVIYFTGVNIGLTTKPPLLVYINVECPLLLTRLSNISQSLNI